MSKEWLYHNNLFTHKRPALFDYQYQKTLAEAPWQDWIDQQGFLECTEAYKTDIHNWLHQSKHSTLSGLNRFSQRHAIVGTTQELDECYWRHSNRRLRIYREEYAYHRENLKYVSLGDEPLQQDDYIIISMPFAGSGTTFSIVDLLDEAYELGCPVIIDAAWWGTGWDHSLDASHPAIESVCFSLSKSIGMGSMRTGIRYSDINYGPIAQQNNKNHLVKATMQLGIHQMRNFRIDWAIDKYKVAYHTLCQQYHLTPSKCLHVAWDDNTLIGVRNAVKEQYKGNLNDC
jgi:hypothetical protein